MRALFICTERSLFDIWRIKSQKRAVFQLSESPVVLSVMLTGSFAGQTVYCVTK
jgi:hypothetical protein